MTSREVVLAKSMDWDDWIYVVRTKADAADVWDLINPNKAVKPAVLPKPTAPIFLMPDSSTPLTTDAYQKHKLQIKNYEILSAEYEKQKKAFADIVSFIQDTITATNAIYIQKAASHPYDILKILQSQVALNKKAQEDVMETLYHKFCYHPGGHEVEKWLDDCTKIYYISQKYGTKESAGDKPVRDFLAAVQEVDPEFAAIHLRKMDSDPSLDFFEVIAKYRCHSEVSNTVVPEWMRNLTHHVNRTCPKN